MTKQNLVTDIILGVTKLPRKGNFRKCLRGETKRNTICISPYYVGVVKAFVSGEGQCKVGQGSRNNHYYKPTSPEALKLVKRMITKGS